MRELSIQQKHTYKNRYRTYLKNKDFINQNDYLLSGEAQGYRWSIFPIIIPAGYKVLDFTEKQIFVIENYLFTDKTFKELTKEFNQPVSSLSNHLSQVCKKLDDVRTEIYWSEGTLLKAKETYAISFSNHGFSTMLIHRLIRKADVTNVLEFMQKPLDEYQKLFTEGSKIRAEVEDKYNVLTTLYKERHHESTIQ